MCGSDAVNREKEIMCSDMCLCSEILKGEKKEYP